MNDSWYLLPAWLKVLLGAMFGLMLFFAVGSIVLGHWSAAVLSWAVVVPGAALFVRLGWLSAAVNGGLSSAQIATFSTLPLVAIWIGRFATSGDRSPILAIGIVVLAGLALRTGVTEGWSRHPD